MQHSSAKHSVDTFAEHFFGGTTGTTASNSCCLRYAGLIAIAEVATKVRRRQIAEVLIAAEDTIEFVECGLEAQLPNLNPKISCRCKADCFKNPRADPTPSTKMKLNYILCNCQQTNQPLRDHGWRSERPQHVMVNRMVKFNVVCFQVCFKVIELWILIISLSDGTD